ncbi:MAG: glycoside hydrolase family 78 protein [Oscillospiraceae bacterium]|nr:glycoside hydrolase family 78 protein [Oscillospiraceae bacterium]
MSGNAFTVYGLLTNELESPMNVEGVPYFSWWLKGGGYDQTQSAYQLLVADGISGVTAWDSGKVASPAQSNVRYAGPALAPGHPYVWRVRVWDANDVVSDYSEAAGFATGLADSDWNADWLQLDDPPKKRSFYWYARTQKPLAAGKKPVRALAYFCMQHEYDLYVNGRRFGRGQCFDYRGEQRYQGWDITQALPPDGADITLALTCRWFNSGQGRDAHVQGLLGHIAVYYDDSSKQVIATDSSWLTSALTPFTPCSRKRNNEGDTIERYDARNEHPGWADPNCDTAGWKAPRVLGAHPNETFPHLTAELGHVTEETARPVSVKKLPGGDTLADFGRVIPARPGVRFTNGRAGRKLKLITGYQLTRSGRINTSRAARQDTNMNYFYTMKAGAAEYNSWEHLGFRYLQIPAAANQDFTADDLWATLYYAEVPAGRDSAFESSDAMLNKVFELMKRSALYSTQNTFVDTPTREKGQFLHDAINISAAATTAWYERATTRKAVTQFLASADRHWADGNDTGRYNAVYPNGEGKRDIPDFTLNLPLMVWRYYMQCGDRALLETAYPYMKSTADYAKRHIAAEGPLTGLVDRLSGGGNGNYKYGNIDWPPVGRFGYDIKACARTTVNALSVQLFDIMALIARELGRDDEEISHYESLAAELRKAINEKLITQEGLYCDGLRKGGEKSRHLGQHSTSYALAFDIAPREIRERMADYIAGMGMRQGPMTAVFLVEALFQSDRPAAALKLLTNKDDYGWAQLIEHHDATFTWEQWTVGQHQSQSHGWGAASVAPLLAYIAGVKVTEPGAASVLINPLTAGLLDSAESRVVTERGPVILSYSGKDRSYTLKIDVPANVRATVVLPKIDGGRFVEQSGCPEAYAFTEAGQVFHVGGGARQFVFCAQV